MTIHNKRQGLLLLGVFLLGVLGGVLIWKLFLNRDRQPDLPVAVNSLGMEFRQVPAGKFIMGSPEKEEERDDDEVEHEVEITRPFYLGIREVTQEQFEKVMGFNPSVFIENRAGGSDHPVENVSWHEAVDFCKRLSDQAAEKEAGRTYRLPTEAEWEYACRAGRKGLPFAFGQQLMPDEANTLEFKKHTHGRTTRVGTHKGNRWYMEDMHGNVWEWCQDWYDPDYYRQGSPQDPQGPGEGVRRVMRGGSRSNEMLACRCANRAAAASDVRLGMGLRVVMVEGEKK